MNMRDLFTNRRKNENPNHQLQPINTAELVVRIKELVMAKQGDVATVQTKDGKCVTGTVQEKGFEGIIKDSLFGIKDTTVRNGGKDYTGKEVGGKK